MSKPACATLGLVERLDRHPLRPVVPYDHHLADPLAIVDGEGLVREVHHGVLSSVMPCFSANPLRGRIWAS